MSTTRLWTAYAADGTEYSIEVTPQDVGWEATVMMLPTHKLHRFSLVSEAHVAHLACGLLMGEGITITDLCPEGIAPRRKLLAKIAGLQAKVDGDTIRLGLYQGHQEKLEAEIEELNNLLEEQEATANEDPLPTRESIAREIESLRSSYEAVLCGGVVVDAIVAAVRAGARPETTESVEF